MGADPTPFLATGYGLTWIALFVYAWRVERRLGDARRAMDEMRDDEGVWHGEPGGDDRS